MAWVQHKKFPQNLTRTQKRRMQRLRAMEKRKLPEKMPLGKLKETKNLREKVRPTLKKTKFGRKATEDNESTEEMDEDMDLRTILMGTFPFFCEMFYYFYNFTKFLKVKRN